MNRWFFLIAMTGLLALAARADARGWHVAHDNSHSHTFGTRQDQDGQSDEDWVAEARDPDFREDCCGDLQPYREVRSRQPLHASQLIKVDGGKNGGAIIEGVDGKEAYFTVRVEARAESSVRAARLASRVRIIEEGGALRAEGPEAGDDAGWYVIFHVCTPHQADISAVTHNGPLSVSDIHGHMDLHTQNGPLAMRNVGGDVLARVQNGPIAISLTGSRWEGKGLDAETVNGPVVLHLPAKYSARLEAGTEMGPANIDLPGVSVARSGHGRRNRHVETVLGDGGAVVRVVTTNGPVQVSNSDSSDSRDGDDDDD